MTLTIWELALYAGALFVLFITPGPVWLAMVARSLSGGFHAAWPLALGVAVGDILWPLVAVAGMSWLVSEIDGIMTILRWLACLMFLGMGVMLLRSAGAEVQHNSALTRPGTWAGFVAGLAAILGNPKAILFYMGLLPGFFDLSAINGMDIAAIVTLSFMVPLLGNLVVAGAVHRLRDMLTTPEALRRVNLVAAGLMIFVGVIIPFT